MFTHEQLQSLNKLEFNVYNYVIKNRDKIVNMTIRELGEKTHVSSTVILKFCQKMNCRGYSEFKWKLEMYNLETKSNLEELNLSYVFDFFKKVNNENLSKNLDEAAKLIAKAPRVIYLGLGASGIMAKYGVKYLTYMSKICQYIDDPFLMMSSSELDKAVIVVLSVSGETQNLLYQVKNFKEANATIISITNSLTNTLANMADISFSYNLPMEQNFHNQVPINITSQIPVVYILETLGRKVQKLLQKNKKI